MNSTMTDAKDRVTRSSLACIPCRSRHLKCDGKRPRCGRCTKLEQDCRYAQSRRGGLTRAALAERRERLAAAARGSNNSQLLVSPARSQDQRGTSRSMFPSPGCLRMADNDIAPPTSLTVTPAHGDNVATDPLIQAYYTTFHRFHPFLPPQKLLTHLYHEVSMQPRLRPLIAILRLIGYIMSSRSWSVSLKDVVDASFAEASMADPIMVQCHLLFSMALFWYGQETEAQREMNTAIRLGLDLQLYIREFAVAQGGQDPVLQESWRRTWWMVYIIDSYYAGTLGTNKSDLWNLEMTVDLPCEESDYESGEIPEPKTLNDFESREFASGSTSFSSFAYLIGAVRCMALAMSTAPKSAGHPDAADAVQMAGTFFDGWRLLLPHNRREIISKSGEIDELMFQAHALSNIVTIAIHRPFSDLKFSSVEDISSCARGSPPNITIPETANVHTLRVLQSVEAQVRLLALPTREFQHTPFITCMVSGATLALLSACISMFQKKELAVARCQIRMFIGRLQAVGEVWPRAARNVSEIQTIARHVLGIQQGRASTGVTPRSSQVPSLLDGEKESGSCADVHTPIDQSEMFPSLETLDGFGWCNSSDLNLDLDLGLDLPWGVNGEGVS